MAIDSVGNVSDLVLARNCCLARMPPREAELVSERTGLSGSAKSVKRFERSNGLDTALYIKLPLNVISATKTIIPALVSSATIDAATPEQETDKNPLGCITHL